MKKSDVYITVDEGKKYYFRDIKWMEHIYPYEFLDAVLNIKKGDVYNHKHLMERQQTTKRCGKQTLSGQRILFSQLNLWKYW
jgi:outer membrane protein insertion porin family